MSKPICERCHDTHKVATENGSQNCTACPTPCQKCRAGGIGAYCETPNCACACHVKGPIEFVRDGLDRVRLYAGHKLATMPATATDLVAALSANPQPRAAVLEGLGISDQGFPAMLEGWRVKLQAAKSELAETKAAHESTWNKMQRQRENVAGLNTQVERLHTRLRAAESALATAERERDDYREGAAAEARRCDELLSERNRARNEAIAALERVEAAEFALATARLENSNLSYQLGKAQGEAEGHALARKGLESELATERARAEAAEAMESRIYLAAKIAVEAERDDLKRQLEEAKAELVIAWEGDPIVPELRAQLEAAQASAVDVGDVEAAIEALELTRWNPQGDIADWAKTGDGHNHAEASRALKALRAGERES